MKPPGRCASTGHQSASVVFRGVIEIDVLVVIDHIQPSFVEGTAYLVVTLVAVDFGFHRGHSFQVGFSVKAVGE